MSRHFGWLLPSAEELRVQIRDWAGAIDTHLCELCTRPTAERAEQLAIALANAQRLVVSYRERLIAEGNGDGR